jgi:Beta/Gamma crystallin
MTAWAKHSKCIVAGALAVCATNTIAGRITLYEGPDFQGHYVTTNDSMAIVGNPAFANSPGSLVVSEGAWEACTDAYFHGRCVQLLPGEYPKVNANLNGPIGSVRQISDLERSATVVIESPPVIVAVSPTWTGRAVLYEYPNFGGARATIDRGQAKDLDWANFSYGHRAASVRVESGTWMFCSEMTFQGECRIFGPGVYAQLSGPLVTGIASAQQVRSAE